MGGGEVLGTQQGSPQRIACSGMQKDSLNPYEARQPNNSHLSAHFSQSHISKFHQERQVLVYTVGVSLAFDGIFDVQHSTKLEYYNETQRKMCFLI